MNDEGVRRNNCKIHLASEQTLGLKIDYPEF